MATESRLRANSKYDKANTKSFIIKLNLKTDADVIERLERVENRQGYIKSLIRRDMGK